MKELFEILLWIIGAILVGVAVVAVLDYLDEQEAKKNIREQFGNTIGAEIKKIAKKGDVKRITFADLQSDKEFAIDARSLDSSIREGAKIYI